MRVIVSVFAAFVVLVAPVFGQTRCCLVPAGGGGGGSQVVGTDIAFDGYARLPGGGGTENQPDTAEDAQQMAVREVSGTVRIFVSMARSGTYDGSWAPVELTDNVTWNPTFASSPILPVYRNWGYSNGAPYDPYHGIYGKTYDSGGSLVNLGGTSPEQNLITGMSWVDATATCCLYTTYSLPYGNYSMSWNTIVTDLSTPGTGTAQQPTGLSTLANGPYRFCLSTVNYDGSGGQECGPSRAGRFIAMPGGAMGLLEGASYTQQNRQNKGPSLWTLASPVTTATTQGFGSTRGTSTYRTTDLLPSTAYLTHWSMDTHINLNGTPTIPFVAMRQPAHVGGSFSQYTYEGYQCANPSSPAAVGETDPTQHGGVGIFTSANGFAGGAWVTGTKTAFITLVSAATGHTWYQTEVCQDFLRSGTSPTEVSLGGGPVYCPLHGVDSYDYPTHAVTGPTTTDRHPAFQIYRQADLDGSYSPDPAEWVWLDDLVSGLHISTEFNTHGVASSLAYAPVARKLYVLFPRADSTTIPGFIKGAIGRFSVGGTTAPAPVPMPLVTARASLVSFSTGVAVFVVLSRRPAARFAALARSLLSRRTRISEGRS